MFPTSCQHGLNLNLVQYDNILSLPFWHTTLMGINTGIFVGLRFRHAVSSQLSVVKPKLSPTRCNILAQLAPLPPFGAFTRRPAPLYCAHLVHETTVPSLSNFHRPSAASSRMPRRNWLVVRLRSAQHSSLSQN